MALASSKNLISVIGRRNAWTSNFRRVGGILDRTVMIAKIKRARIRNAHIRIVQPKPTLGTRCVTMIGNMTPPNDEPAATRPSACPLFAKNHVVTDEKAG